MTNFTAYTVESQSTPVKRVVNEEKCNPTTSSKRNTKQAPAKGITLEDYAKRTHLTVEFLEDLGVYQKIKDGKQAVHFPYVDENDDQVAVHIRVKWAGLNDAKWKTGSNKNIPYGVWRDELLQCCSQKPGVTKEIYLVENEHSAQILWYRGYNALCVPQFKEWNSDWDKYLNGFDEIYIWNKPNKDISPFITQIHQSFPKAKIITSPKDVLTIHTHSGNFDEDLKELSSNAIAISKIYAQREEDAINLAK